MWLLVTLAIGAIFGYAMIAVFAPWVFYLGGRSFHIEAGWHGWGRMHSNISGDYALYIRLMPDATEDASPGSLGGSAYICTPRGEIIGLRLNGEMRSHLNLITDGEAITLDMSRSRAFTEVLAGNRGIDDRPNLRFSGQWQNPNLVLTDSGSLSSAFQPDGAVYRGHDAHRLPPKEIVPLTLKPGSYDDFKASCLAPKT